MNAEKLQINRIRVDGGTQARVQLDWIAIDDYANAMQEGAAFPPVVVFYDGDQYWLADGFHRLKAAEKAGSDELSVDVRPGTRHDAMWHAAGANSVHGVRRSNADKRNSVRLALKVWVETRKEPINSTEIARQVGVSHQMVINIAEQDGVSRKTNDMKTVSVSQVIPNSQNLKIWDNSDSKTKPTQSQPAGIKQATAPLYTPPHARKAEHQGDQPDRRETNKYSGDDTRDDGPHHNHRNNDTGEKDEIPAALSHTHEIPSSVNIICGNSSIVLADDRHVETPVHLVVTSPPYNVGIDYDTHMDDLSTYFELMTDTWRQCHRHMVEGARICVVVPFGVGRNPWVPLAGPVMATLVEAGFTLRGQIIWDKNTTGNRTSWGSFRLPTNPSLRDTTECIVVAQKGDGTLAIPDYAKAGDEKGTYTAWLRDSDYFMELAQDHWVVAPESAKRIGHPAPFPPELVRRLAHFYGFPGMHMLDPFSGSGTVGVVARELDCAATLIDLSEEYCNNAKQRIG